MLFLLMISFQDLKAQQDAPAYQGVADSINQLITEATTDSARYALLGKIIDEVEAYDRMASIPYLLRQLSLAKSALGDFKVAASSTNLGSNYLLLGNTDSAFVHLSLALEINQRLDSLQQVTDILNSMALIYQRSNQYLEAVGTYQQVILNSDSLSDPIGMIYAQVNLMSLFMDLDDHNTALDYHKEIEEVISIIPENDVTAHDELNDIYSAILLNTGLCYEEEGLMDSAIYFFQKAEEFIDSISYEYGRIVYKAYIDNSLGDAYYDMGKSHDNQDSTVHYTRKAFEKFTAAQEAFVSVSDKRGECFTLNNLGKCHVVFGDLRIAQQRLEDALQIALSIDFKEEIRDSYEYLALHAQKTGNVKKENEYLKNWITYKDSIRNEERENAIITKEIVFNVVQTEKELTEMELAKTKADQRSRNLQIFFISIVIFGLVLAYMLFSRFRFKKQKEKTEFEREVNHAMSRFVPMAFINAIGRDKITEVELGDQIEKEVTVVFTDIRSFTAISEGMTPKENFAFVKEYAERMGPIIERNGGFISQYLGDGLMAIFQNSPADALVACIEMQQDIEDYNKDLLTRGKNPIKVGMGMHTGPLVMGIIGHESRRDATLISDTVNTAARIESTTKTLGADILLSEDSVKRLNDVSSFRLEAMGEVNVKGKTIPIQVFQCHSNLPSNDR